MPISSASDGTPAAISDVFLASAPFCLRGSLALASRLPGDFKNT
jgi:hypothetical protein